MVDACVDVARRPRRARATTRCGCRTTSSWTSQKYGGAPDAHGVYEPLVTLAALGRVCTERVRLGTLVLCEALRPAAVLAKALATLDRVCDGRLDVGLGAGWYEPEYTAIGIGDAVAGCASRPSARVRRRRARRCCGGGPSTSTASTARCRGAPQRPAGGPAAGTDLRRRQGRPAARARRATADGWNTCWAWTPDRVPRARSRCSTRACERSDATLRSIPRSLGLYTLCGEDERDLERRFERLVASTPAGVLDGVTLEEWRQGRLVGTVDEVREQVAEWAALGVETIIVGFGAVPFQLAALDDARDFGAAIAASAP